MIECETNLNLGKYIWHMYIRENIVVSMTIVAFLDPIIFDGIKFDWVIKKQRQTGETCDKTH